MTLLARLDQLSREVASDYSDECIFAVIDFARPFIQAGFLVAIVERPNGHINVVRFPLPYKLRGRGVPAIKRDPP